MKYIKCLEWYVALSKQLIDIGNDGSEVKKVIVMVTMVMMVIMLMMMNQKVLQKYLLLKTELAPGHVCNL